jgi:hypothetical protein
VGWQGSWAHRGAEILVHAVSRYVQKKLIGEPVFGVSSDPESQVSVALVFLEDHDLTACQEVGETPSGSGGHG